ncbi:Polysialic acid O-acetyltransferase [Liparis tanakae]|uniref:Polysialic acid O-acetyltransferase n=1 Tax=Liparis tanakae TaxID=230148 RepID=A0A4Z2E196_9TELE|nr:Polysialic acid O-acetyltransferase [Liparis tanakae]
MNFAISLFVLPFCGLTLAQKSNDANLVEKITETQSCNPDMCEILKEWGAMTERMRAMETRLTDSESRLKVSESRLKVSEIRLKDSETRLKVSEIRLKVSETRLTESETQILELKNKGNVKLKN